MITEINYTPEFCFMDLKYSISHQLLERFQLTAITLQVLILYHLNQVANH